MGSVTPDWLKQLAPAHAPMSSGFWPLAPGWWGLLVLLVILIAALMYWQSRPAVRLRRTALRELKKIQAATIDDIELASSIENLLRRYAVARFGRSTIAGLSGKRWIAFVVEHGGAAWSGDTGASLLRAAYGGTAKADRNGWLTGAHAFIRGRT